ncbi:MAG: helix-turn-helix domain-containing protein [Alphaproteobacteria bacterium]|nr:helix-turn-helix domain-containing protein [Alphaproteobacteria bacterium]
MSQTLSIKEACEYLGISRYTLNAEIGAGKMDFLQVGKRIRFTKEVLEKWLKNTVTLTGFSKGGKPITHTFLSPRKVQNTSSLESLRDALKKKKQNSTQ